MVLVGSTRAVMVGIELTGRQRPVIVPIEAEGLNPEAK